MPQIQFAINNTVHATSGTTASELLMGYRPRHMADAVLTTELDEAGTRSKRSMSEIKDQAFRNVEDTQKRQKVAFDKKRKEATRYNKRDLALVLRSKVGGGSRKLLPNYRGPFEVAATLPNDRYVLSELKGSHRVQKAPFKSVEAVDRMKPWVPIGGLSSSEDENDENQVRKSLSDEDVRNVRLAEGNVAFI